MGNAQAPRVDEPRVFLHECAHQNVCSSCHLLALTQKSGLGLPRCAGLIQVVQGNPQSSLKPRCGVVMLGSCFPTAATALEAKISQNGHSQI
eukprot:5251574-Amphidinium_carterae.2